MAFQDFDTLYGRDFSDYFSPAPNLPRDVFYVSVVFSWCCRAYYKKIKRANKLFTRIYLRAKRKSYFDRINWCVIMEGVVVVMNL